MNKYFFILFFISTIDTFIIYSTMNYKYSRIIQQKHWNDIYKNLNDNIYYTKYHKWKFYNNNLLVQRKYSKFHSYSYKKNIINISNTIYNIHNNTKIFLIDNHAKVYVNKFVQNNIDVCIYHPYNQDYMFNINIIYDNITNKLDNIIYKTNVIENNIHYWNDNYKIKIMNETNKLLNENTFLFGYNLKLTYPLQIIRNLNIDNIYKKQYPYLYERYKYDNLDYYLIKMPHDIELNIPKNNSNKHYNILWSFKDQFKKNIIDLKYFENGTLNFINYFIYT
tara:strand:- start:1314 stop:2150 length:837 start_codon:yes stop_codon:yes gene_type:complete